MTRYSDFNIKGPNANTPVGSPIYVLIGNSGSTGTTAPSTLEGGRYVRAGRSYLKSEYPALFDKIGQIYSNAQSWTEINLSATINPATTPLAIAASNSVVAIGGSFTGGIATSTDSGSTFTLRNIGTTSAVNGLVYGLDKFVAVGNGGMIRTSTDGVSWYPRISGTTSAINSVAYVNNLFIYGGTGGVLRTSTNGVNWSPRSSGTTTTIRSITYGNGLYVIAGDGGMLRTSTDTLTWTARTTGTSSLIYSVAYGRGVYVIAGAGGMLRSSTDTVTWTVRSSETTLEIRSLIYGKGLFLYWSEGLVGQSLNGTTWTTRTSPAAGFGLNGFRANAITFNDNWYFVTGGNPTLNPRVGRSLVTSDLETEFFVPTTTQTFPSRETSGDGFTSVDLALYIRAKDV